MHLSGGRVVTALAQKVGGLRSPQPGGAATHPFHQPGLLYPAWQGMV